MSISYRCVSKKNPNMFEKVMDSYLDCSLHHIQWEIIFELLHIRLDSLFDTRINYWAPEQVAHMRDSIKSLYEDPHKTLYIPPPYETEQEINLAKSLKDDIKILLDHFTYLVDNESYIYVV